MKPKDTQKGIQIIFFDGVCNLCNQFVDYVIQRDQNHIFLFAPLQGLTAKEKVPEKIIQDLKTVALYQNDEIFTQSTAALKILKQIGFIHFIVGSLFMIIPTSIRDSIYHWISKNRYRLFGKKETCRIPTPEERKRFLT